MSRLVKKGTQVPERQPAPKPESEEAKVKRIRNTWLAERKVKEETQRMEVLRWLKS